MLCILPFLSRVGDMLYIPAGWYHEVFSLGTGNEYLMYFETPFSSMLDLFPAFTTYMDIGMEISAGGGGHMAFNYWFHPPDDLSNFEQPYSSKFWLSDWESRKCGLGVDLE